MTDFIFLIIQSTMNINFDMSIKKYNFLIRNSVGKEIKSKVPRNDQLGNGLYKSVIRKFRKCKYYSPFMDNTWCADLDNTQLCRR